MTFTDIQIAHLFAFTERKMVRWYDLQVELVDHLANKIEDLMEADTKLSFERALGNVYESFGLFGFAHIVQKKEAEMQKQNNKMWWKQFKLQFGWPNIFRTFSVVVGFYLLNKITFLNDLLMIVLTLLNIGLIMYSYRFLFLKSKEKKLLMMQFLPFNSIITAVYIQIYLNLFFIVVDNSRILNDATIIIANCVSFTGTLLLINGYEIYKKVYAKAKLQYPNAFVK